MRLRYDFRSAGNSARWGGFQIALPNAVHRKGCRDRTGVAFDAQRYRLGSEGPVVGWIASQNDDLKSTNRGVIKHPLEDLDTFGIGIGECIVEHQRKADVLQLCGRAEGWGR